MTRVCYQCTDRHVGCHSKCKKYIKAKSEYDAQKQQIMKQKEKDNNYFNFKQAAVRKAKHK